MNSIEKQLARVIAWPPQDVRWEGFRHFMERVGTAGIGLVSQEDRALIVEKHILPSLEGLDLLPPPAEGLSLSATPFAQSELRVSPAQQGKRILDIGSGGGFPAIPLAMARPDLEWLLIEASVRKTEFLKRVSRETSLQNVTVLCERVEKLGKEHEGQFEVVTARAVTEIRDLIKWSQRLLKPEGRWLLWKSTNWKKEKGLDSLGIEVLQERKLSHGGVLLEVGMRN